MKFLPSGYTVEPSTASLQATEEGVRAFFWLNVGPRPWGDIHPEEQQALRRIGQMRRAL